MPLASTGAPQGPFGFAASSGYQEDGDTGLKLLGHRYCDPSTGRFLTRDPAQDGRNWYGYCDSNPLKRVDPTGHLWLWDRIKAALYEYSLEKEPVDMVKPPAAALGAGIILWALWETVSGIHGNHDPGNLPTQPGHLGPTHGYLPRPGDPDTPPEGFWHQQQNMYDDDNHPPE